MKIEIQNKKGLTTVLSIIIEKKEIQKKMDQKLQELQSEVSLKGFRPGKVPPAVIRRQFGKAIYGEIIDKTVVRPFLFCISIFTASLYMNF